MINSVDTSVEFGIDGHFQPLTRESPGYIAARIKLISANGPSPCFQFRINAPGINVSLSTPACRIWGGSGRSPNREEEAILDLWEAKGLHNQAYTADSAASFAKEMTRRFV